MHWISAALFTQWSTSLWGSENPHHTSAPSAPTTHCFSHLRCSTSPPPIQISVICHWIYCYHSVVLMAVSRIVSHLYSAPPLVVTPSEFRKDV